MNCRKCGKNLEIYRILPQGAIMTTKCCEEYAIIRFHNVWDHKNDKILLYYN